MYFLIYTSYAIQANDHFFKALLEQARENNKKRMITGLLLYLNGTFIQLIEGEKDQVQSLYRTIRQDHRHISPVVLVDGTRNERYFKDWSMGFKAISEQDMEAEENYRSLKPPTKENTEEVLKIFTLLSDRSAELEGNQYSFNEITIL